MSSSSDNPKKSLEADKAKKECLDVEEGEAIESNDVEVVVVATGEDDAFAFATDSDDVDPSAVEEEMNKAVADMKKEMASVNEDMAMNFK